MTPLTAKQKEIRGRERRILRVAAPMIGDGGLTAIRMDAIAKEMGVTRGTIYNHFPNREDIVLALADRAVRRRIAMFEFGASLSKHSREQIAAIGLACEVYSDEMPEDFAVEQLVRHDTVWQKCSDARRDRLLGCESECMVSVGRIIQHAIESGDLALPKRESPADVLFGLWSLVYGGLVIEATSPSLADVGIRDSREAIRRNCNAMLDGIRWQPLYEPDTYRKLVRRLRPKLIQHAQNLRSQDDHGSTESQDDLSTRRVEE